MATEFQRPATVVDAVLGELRRMILSRDLLPGQPIVLEALAERMGVSKVPVREALKRLEGEGQVDHRPHRGYVVAELDLNELLEIYRMRDLLESEALRIAIPKLGERHLDAMETAMLEIEELGEDLLEISHANRRFHFALMTACERKQLLRIIRLLWDSTEPYRILYYMNTEIRESIVHAEHRDIWHAAQRRDAEAVVEALRVHRNTAINELKSVLDA